MALVLGVSENEVIYVGDRRCTIYDIRSGDTYKIKVEDGFFDKVFHVSSDRSVEILPEVKVMAGAKRKGLPTIAFEAPSHIVILREELYETAAGAKSKR